MQTKKSSSQENAGVVIETKKMTDSNCCKTGSCCNCGNVTSIITMVLLVLNTVLLVMSFSMIRHSESSKVGGRENYKMAQEIYKTDGFKQYQKKQIQDALNTFKGGNQQNNPVAMPETAQPAPSNEAIAE